LRRGRNTPRTMGRRAAGRDIPLVAIVLALLGAAAAQPGEWNNMSVDISTHARLELRSAPCLSCAGYLRRSLLRRDSFCAQASARTPPRHVRSSRTHTQDRRSQRLGLLQQEPSSAVQQAQAAPRGGSSPTMRLPRPRRPLARKPRRATPPPHKLQRYGPAKRPRPRPPIQTRMTPFWPQTGTNPRSSHPSSSLLPQTRLGSDTICAAWPGTTAAHPPARAAAKRLAAPQPRRACRSSTTAPSTTAAPLPARPSHTAATPTACARWQTWGSTPARPPRTPPAAA
jgi:hypothetical protein